MGKSLVSPFFVSFLLVATILSFSSEVNCIVGPLECVGGGTRELYITASCEVCDQLCQSIQGVVCAECSVSGNGVPYCTCVFPQGA
ncbi:hypothetical protein MKW98_013466 [Papaver atlanticum]|uniref:Uncharacterized protein n=1 Tax=Papaver atlanticum TaxID=357466 RepID=A0AAD4SU15_9MAGN|nr:hypothetical protein MKW98_013466 [Papaver atlanticum]